jgi:uncharacterized protein (DUF1684 family)
METNPIAELWDWRRQIAELYAEIRRASDPLAAWRDWRATRDALFAHHAQTPLEAPGGFAGLTCYPYDPSLRFTVALAPVATAPVESWPAGADGTVRMQAFARTIGLAPELGGELRLYWILGYGGGVFLPFRDATSGAETYGAGRYLLDTIKGADLGLDAGGRTILDFNFSYFPSCAYSPRWVCPLTPAANRLPMPVRGGERLSTTAPPVSPT